MNDSIQVERDGAVCILTMDLPARRNALSPALVDALEDAVRDASRNTEVRAIVLQGEGGHFCAGGDLSTLDATAAQTRAGIQTGHRTIRRLIDNPKPVIAAVEGNAYGAGFSLAMACDHVIGDSNTTFCAAFGRVGLMPDYGLLWTLPQRIGMGRARTLMLFCEAVGGAAALELGLIDQLATDGGVREAARACAHRLAALPASSLAATKAALARHPLSLDTLLAWEADAQTLLVASEDFRNSVQAFAKRRGNRPAAQA